MLSRTLFQRSLSFVTRSHAGCVTNTKLFVPNNVLVPLNTQQRSIITIVSEEEDENDADAELSILAHKAVHMGSEPYPNYKREALMKSEKMKMRKNRQYGKRANHKVRALVDFIEFKNSRKFQD